MASPYLLDIRPERDFLAGHAARAVGIPLEELARRMHELPAKGQVLEVYDPDPARLAHAVDLLRARGYAVRPARVTSADLQAAGPSTIRLWQPSPFLVEALELIGRHQLSERTAIDLGCGSGREAVFLALQGFAVDAIDVLPDALARADDLAARNAVRIRTRQQDLRHDTALPENRYALACMFRFHEPRLWPAVRAAVRPGGYAVFEVFHADDPAARHGAADGELQSFLGDWRVLVARGPISRDGRVFAQIVGQKPE